MTHSVDSLNIDILVFLGITDCSSIPVCPPDVYHWFSGIRSSLHSQHLRLTSRQKRILIREKSESDSFLLGRGNLGDVGRYRCDLISAFS
jgi:hypothetical protein